MIKIYYYFYAFKCFINECIRGQGCAGMEGVQGSKWYPSTQAEVIACFTIRLDDVNKHFRYLYYSTTRKLQTHKRSWFQYYNAPFTVAIANEVPIRILPKLLVII